MALKDYPKTIRLLKRSNQSLQPTAGRRDACTYYETVVDVSHGRRQRWLSSVSLGEVYPMNSKIAPAQLSPGVLYPRAKSRALSRIIIFGALIAASVNVRGARAR